VQLAGTAVDAEGTTRWWVVSTVWLEWGDGTIGQSVRRLERWEDPRLLANHGPVLLSIIDSAVRNQGVLGRKT
jgi:hypothetical protein